MGILKVFILSTLVAFIKNILDLEWLWKRVIKGKIVRKPRAPTTI